MLTPSPRRRPLAPCAEALESRALLAVGFGPPASSWGHLTRPRPMTVTAELAQASDPAGLGMVTRPVATIAGVTMPGATVRLVEGSARPAVARADARGAYHFTVPVGNGATAMQVQATDRAGRRATADLTVTRGDAVIAWVREMLATIRADNANVGLATRTMAMVSAAAYDAVNDITRSGAVYHIDVAAPRYASAAAAASEASYRVLLDLYPAQKARLDVALAETLAAIPAGAPRRAGMAVGDEVAAGMMAWRADDGSAASVPYVPGTAPGQWRPTWPTYQVAWGPEWGSVTPFAVPTAAMFQPPPPPALGSAAYAAAYDQVKSLGALHSTTRTPEETQTGIFWAYDRTGLGTPPAHYDEIAEAVALQQHNTLDQDARMFALVNVAMADAGISAWDAKYTYNRWRPITAIQLGNTDGNAATVGDPTWLPLGAPGGPGAPNFTPPFPSYVSGHATFGGAMFTVLADFYGTDAIRFTIGSDELPGVYRTYDSFSAASAENAASRIYLGIHFAFDESAGVAVGDAIGQYVYKHEMA